MTTIEFQGFPKIPRLFRNSMVTEKIDGTNGAIGIRKFPFGWHDHHQHNARLVMAADKDESGLPDSEYLVYAQSRNRVISTGEDNHGFADWVYRMAYSLVADLGPGLHFGEWWGSGIGRNYGLSEKRFSLFNAKRWEDADFITPALGVVPVIERGEFSTLMVHSALEMLRIGGSYAAPQYMQPEGVVVYHAAGNTLFKATLENDAIPKLSVIRELREQIADVYDIPIPLSGSRMNLALAA